eukprot:TRINITY_DN3126_c0_g6_i1.p1 TRINITY_DN3126_c0_g6~~TRINITY_DN3126_c0_g6_i1.p1  ORF type:complete len:102 (+),score=11.43 TRINITY_DN3126_c0_g6_i1:40-345(+)
MKERDASFCKAVENIYVMSGCGPALGTGHGSKTVIPILKKAPEVRKVSNADFRAAVARGTGPGLTSLQKSCLTGPHGGCVMLHKKNGLGKLPILKASALHQ